MKPLYAIRHKPTGHFLPEPKGRMGRGGSHVEPVDCSNDGENPRLFQSKLSAQRALTAWLRGKHTAEIDYDYDEYNGHAYPYQAGVHVKPVPSRIKEEMEIVSFQLMLEEKR